MNARSGELTVQIPLTCEIPPAAFLWAYIFCGMCAPRKADSMHVVSGNFVLEFSLEGVENGLFLHEVEKRGENVIQARTHWFRIPLVRITCSV